MGKGEIGDDEDFLVYYMREKPAAFETSLLLLMLHELGVIPEADIEQWLIEVREHANDQEALEKWLIEAREHAKNLEQYIKEDE